MTPADRWTHADDSPASREREEGREAARFDKRELVPICGEWCDVDEVPIELRGVYE